MVNHLFFGFVAALSLALGFISGIEREESRMEAHSKAICQHYGQDVNAHYGREVCGG